MPPYPKATTPRAAKRSYGSSELAPSWPSPERRRMPRPSRPGLNHGSSGRRTSSLRVAHHGAVNPRPSHPEPPPPSPARRPQWPSSLCCPPSTATARESFCHEHLEPTPECRRTPRCTPAAARTNVPQHPEPTRSRPEHRRTPRPSRPELSAPPWRERRRTQSPRGPHRSSVNPRPSRPELPVCRRNIHAPRTFTGAPWPSRPSRHKLTADIIAWASLRPETPRSSPERRSPRQSRADQPEATIALEPSHPEPPCPSLARRPQRPSRPELPACRSRGTTVLVPRASASDTAALPHIEAVTPQAARPHLGRPCATTSTAFTEAPSRPEPPWP